MTAEIMVGVVVQASLVDAPITIFNRANPTEEPLGTEAQV